MRLALNPQKYSHATRATSWHPRRPQSVSFGVDDDFEMGSWRPEDTNMPGHAVAMKSSDALSRASITGGKSYSAELGGFDAMLLGNRLDGETANYGNLTGFLLMVM